MSILYITQDRIGTATGGGAVTGFECDVLASLGEEVERFDYAAVPASIDPFENDEMYCRIVSQFVADRGVPRMAHFYAGCFSLTAEFLKSKGTKVSYTVDAHNPDRSIEEFGRCGVTYPFKHMSDRNLRAMYLRGYTLADLVIVPSVSGKEIVESMGCKNVIVIPHPVRSFQKLPLPERLAVGYLGQSGPDKGIRYLLEAWKIVGLKGIPLIFAGNNGKGVMRIWRQEGGRNIEIMGEVEKEEMFFRRISIYVQPSVTEGFGIPVLEAMACGRPVIVSEGAGAVEAVRPDCGFRVPIRDPKAIAQAIRFYLENPEKVSEHGEKGHCHSENYCMDVIRGRYLEAWENGL